MMAMQPRMKLTFVGTGVSCAIPVIGHLGTDCACRDAIANPGGPNRRNNVALLLSVPFATPTEGGATAALTGGSAHERVKWHHVLIDCGKTFRNAYMRVLAPMRVAYVDALLITHGHADAMHCAEDVCAMQAEAAKRLSAPAAAAHAEAPAGVISGATPRSLRRLPTFLTAPALEQIAMVSPELVRHSVDVGPAPASRSAYDDVLTATVGKAARGLDATTPTPAEGTVSPSTVMDLFYMDATKPAKMYLPLRSLPTTSATATASGSRQRHAGEEGAEAEAEAELPFYSFPVEHGKGYTSMAWVFGRGTAFRSRPGAPAAGSCVVYISDVSEVPAASMAFLQDLVKIDVLIVDCLAERGSPSMSHYCMDEALPLVVALAPRRAYFVGMFCSLEHHRTNAQLAEELAQLKVAVQNELDAEAAADEGGAARDVNAAAALDRKRSFVLATQSIELAYDGQQLDMAA